jgi:hypothetical protein
MTQDEASKIAAIIATADGGCAACVRSLCDLMSQAGLGFSFRMTDKDVELQSPWSNDPDDTITIPEVIAEPMAAAS